MSRDGRSLRWTKISSRLPRWSPTERLWNRSKKLELQCQSSSSSPLFTCSSLWRVRNDMNSAKETIQTLLKRVTSTRNPNVQLVAFTILDSCMKNCGRVFQIEVAAADVLDKIAGLLQTKVQTNAKVCDRIKELIQDWDTDLSNITAFHRVYENLKREGYDFPPKKKPTSTSSAPRPAAAAPASQEDAELAMAIARSLQESQPKVTPPSSQPPPQPLKARYARALFNFDTTHDDELPFKEGDILTLLNTSDANWWQGELRGRTGLIPVKYVEAVDDHTPTQPAAAAAAAAPVAAAVTAAPSAGATTAAPAPTSAVAQTAEPTIVSPTMISELLQLIANADAAGDNLVENEKIRVMTDMCNASRAPVSAKLSDISNQNAQLMALNDRFCKAFLLYDQLLKTPQPPKAAPFPQPQPLQQMGPLPPQQQQQQPGNFAYPPQQQQQNQQGPRPQQPFTMQPGQVPANAGAWHRPGMAGYPPAPGGYPPQQQQQQQQQQPKSGPSFGGQPPPQNLPQYAPQANHFTHTAHSL
ncbi:hypothetical protein CAOG_007755 [Capsaspora owczarzaki ATCC 30864]|uniref:Class E vacuolar protein-sorting machinery protein hse1 n=1 Tax=Capsaspora owczarzaki (strain ATCC 30864) TaxID=595528 RepID=A0A0D2WXV2_CAPO3|nr:hypothetical protein CAOG_007755 [Capsaspora owczarzaki ATCC 30864]